MGGTVGKCRRCRVAVRGAYDLSTNSINKPLQVQAQPKKPGCLDGKKCA